MTVDQGELRQRGLPRYYLITALVVLMLLVLAGGLIYYRLAFDALEVRAAEQNLAFAGTIETLARRAVSGADVAAKLQERCEAEMAQRPVVKVSVYDDAWRIRFSTHPQEKGMLVAVDERSFGYERSDGKLIHYAVFDTGTDTLRDRDLLVSRLGIGKGYWNRAPGIIVYADITAERRSTIQGDVLVVGVIELALAIALGVALLRRG